MKRRLRNVWITAATPGAPVADIRGDINFSFKKAKNSCIRGGFN